MKIFKGVVISTKMKNTATVSVSSAFVHRLYGKRFTRTKKYHVHDEYSSKVGDNVNFVASKPFSKIKKWKIIKTDEDKKTASRRKQRGKATSRKNVIPKTEKKIGNVEKKSKRKSI